MKKFLIMFFSLTLILGIAPKISVNAQEPSNKRFIMYYGDWSVGDDQGNFLPKDMPADLYTHLNYAFIDFDDNGDLMFDEIYAYKQDNGLNAPHASMQGLLSAVTHLKTENPNLKVGISLGGWSKSGDFSAVAKDDIKRKNFVDQVMRLVDYANLDFVDVDWEYPGMERFPDLIDNKEDEGTPLGGPDDKWSYPLLLKDLRAALDEKSKSTQKDYELSIAATSSGWNASFGPAIADLFEHIDFANIMTYDTHGNWDQQAYHHTALMANPKYPNMWTAEHAVNFYKNQGAPSEKIVIGVANYSRGFHKVSSDNTDANLPGFGGEILEDSTHIKEDGSPVGKGAWNDRPLVDGDQGHAAGLWAYRNFDRLDKVYPGMVEYWDDVSKMNYMYNKDTGAFLSYDSVKSVEAKSNYVLDNDLGGIIVWMASQDKETASGKRDELATTIHKTLFKNGNPVANKNHRDVEHPGLSIKVENNTITITNDYVPKETVPALKQAELNRYTFKNPVLIFETEEETTTFEISEYIAPGDVYEIETNTLKLGSLKNLFERNLSEDKVLNKVVGYKAIDLREEVEEIVPPIEEVKPPVEEVKPPVEEVETPTEDVKTPVEEKEALPATGISQNITPYVMLGFGVMLVAGVIVKRKIKVNN